MDYSPEVVRRFEAAAAGQAGFRAAAPGGDSTSGAGRPIGAAAAGPIGAESSMGATSATSATSASSRRVVAAESEDRTLNVWVRFEVEVSQGVIRRAGFQVFGCPHTVAAASWVADALLGRPAESLAQIDMRQVGRELDVPIEKLGKLLRIEDAVSACRQRLGETAQGIEGRRYGNFADEKCG